MISWPFLIKTVNASMQSAYMTMKLADACGLDAGVRDMNRWDIDE